MNNTAKGLLMLGVALVLFISALYVVGGFEGVVILFSIITFVGFLFTGLHLLTKDA